MPLDKEAETEIVEQSGLFMQAVSHTFVCFDFFKLNEHLFQWVEPSQFLSTNMVYGLKISINRIHNLRMQKHLLTEVLSNDSIERKKERKKEKNFVRKKNWKSEIERGLKKGR